MDQHRCYGCMQLHDGDFCPSCGWPNHRNNEPHQLPVGTILRGQYEVGRVLGQGGFGITYLGWDRHLETAVCIKEYFPNHAVSRDCAISTQVHCHTQAGAEAYRASKERFLREGKILAQFRDIPEIVSIYGFFEENDTVYIVMEYIKGMDLAHYIRHRGGRLTAEETFRILKPVMEALAQVHRAELVHRDIAPDNIMLHPRGGAKLLDFGAARMVENAGVDKGLDRSTEAIVKHGFAPMEQYQTRGNLGPWTDVYAMCASVYYCLTGQIPPEATSRMMGEAPFNWNNVPGLTQRQRWALEKGMAILPRDRYASMEELLDGLFGEAPIPMNHTEPMLTPPWQPPQAPVYQPPQPPAYQPPVVETSRKKKGGKSLMIALTALLAVVVIGVGGFLVANLLSDTVNRGPLPATEAPQAVAPATEAPVAEAPIVEVPDQELYFGVILQSAAMADLPEQLAAQLADMGMACTVETGYASSTDDYFPLAEAYIASGCDALILQLANPLDERTEEMLAMLSAKGMPTILVGFDPCYDTQDNNFFEDYPGVCYVGADPRFISAQMAMMLLSNGGNPDKDGSNGISYVFLGGATASWESGVIEQCIGADMESNGYRANLMAEYSDLDSAEDAYVCFEEALVAYYDTLEAVFCTDANAAMGAIMACEAAGISMDDLAVIALGDGPEMADYYEKGYLKGYMEYSREALVDQLAQVLMAAAWGEPLEQLYPVGITIYAGR